MALTVVTGDALIPLKTGAALIREDMRGFVAGFIRDTTDLSTHLILRATDGTNLPVYIGTNEAGTVTGSTTQP